MAPVIPLRRIKHIAVSALRPRFAEVEKVPAKDAEYRALAATARERWAGRQAVVGATVAKYGARARRHGKLRLFRVFKLLGALKADALDPRCYRPVAERLRAVRWRRRL